MAAVSLKCPNCGAGLHFDPAAQDYECEYCLSRFSQEELERLEPEVKAEQDGDSERNRGSSKEGQNRNREKRNHGSETQEENESAQAEDAKAVVYTCPSCGAEIVTDETTAASFCFYCQNPVILAGRLEGRYHPDYILPFSVDKEKATEIFLDWLKSKRFVPSDFYSPQQIEKMTGVYFPYWLYSCKVDGRLEGDGVKYRKWKTGNIQYTETQTYNISRSGTMGVDHLSRNALKKADKKLVEGVMPFDIKTIKPFSMGFLSGFFAEKRDMEQEEFAKEVEQEIRGFATSSLESSVNGYSSMNVTNKEVKIRNPSWEYALLPVWTLTYREKKTGNVYYFACNGQNGKVCGKLPLDSKKLWLYFAKIFLPLFAVFMAVGYFI